MSNYQFSPTYSFGEIQLEVWDTMPHITYKQDALKGLWRLMDKTGREYFLSRDVLTKNPDPPEPGAIYVGDGDNSPNRYIIGADYRVYLSRESSTLEEFASKHGEMFQNKMNLLVDKDGNDMRDR